MKSRLLSRLAMRAPAKDNGARSLAFWLLALLAIGSFLLGGGSRDDILSLIILRPLTAIILVLAIAVAWRRAWGVAPVLLTLMLMSVVAVAVQLVPLAPGVWSSLGGREPVVAAFEAAGMPLPWLPLSMTPSATWNALFALMTPAAALVLALAIRPAEEGAVIKLLIAIGLVSVLVAVLQVIGPPEGPLYFYRITNNGFAVGLFSNRNHQAMLLACLLPWLAYFYAVHFRQRTNAAKVALGMAVLLTAAVLLVTGARSGLAAGLVSVVFGFAILLTGDGRARRTSMPRRALLLGGGLLAAVAGVFGLTLLFSRATSVDRLVDNEAGEDLRVQALPTLFEIVGDMWPWGSGYGSFPQVFQIYEPSELLSPNYFNHAHNDVVELAMTGGLPALVLLAAGILWMLWTAWSLWRTRGRLSPAAIAMALAAIGSMLILVLGSIADYPLRTPSLALFFVVMAALLARTLRGNMLTNGESRT